MALSAPTASVPVTLVEPASKSRLTKVAAATVIGSAIEAFDFLAYGTIPFCGWLADQVGARRLYVAGGVLLACAAVPLFQGLATGSVASYTVSVVVALSICIPPLRAPDYPSPTWEGSTCTNSWPEPRSRLF